MLASSQSSSPNFPAPSSPKHPLHARPYNVSHSPRLSRRSSQQQIASPHRSTGISASAGSFVARTVSTSSQTSPLLRRMVDAATQYSPQKTGLPVCARDPESQARATSAPGTPELVQTHSKRRAESCSPPVESVPQSPPEPNPRINPQPVVPTPLSSQDVVQQPVTPSNQPRSATPKRPRPDAPAMKAMPVRYQDCDVRDLGIIIADMLMELIRTNDGIPLLDGGLTRFHSR